MPVYIVIGPAAAIIGIVAIFFVMRNRSTQKKSMYSSRRGQIERKVQAARSRTLAPHGRSQKPPTTAEIAAGVPMAPTYEAPAAPPRQAWEQPAAPPAPPEYTPPPAPEYAAPAAATPAPPATPFAEPFSPPPAPAQPEWATPAPSEPVWTPAPAPASDFSAPAEPAAPAAAEPATPISTPAGGGASWEVVGGDAPQPEPASEPRGKKSKDEQKQQTGGAWSLSSGEAAGAAGDEGDEEVKKPSAAMAIAQYAVLVVGLVMVLIGVLVMVANAKVT
jgi:uncharacterized integral membrane protein